MYWNSAKRSFMQSCLGTFKVWRQSISYLPDTFGTSFSLNRNPFHLLSTGNSTGIAPQSSVLTVTFKTIKTMNMSVQASNKECLLCLLYGLHSKYQGTREAFEHTSQQEDNKCQMWSECLKQMKPSPESIWKRGTPAPHEKVLEKTDWCPEKALPPWAVLSWEICSLRKSLYLCKCHFPASKMSSLTFLLLKVEESTDMWPNTLVKHELRFKNKNRCFWNIPVPRTFTELNLANMYKQLSLNLQGG